MDGWLGESGAELLDELQAALTRYLVLPTPEGTDAVTLWIVASHGQPAWQHAPRLAVQSTAARDRRSAAPGPARPRPRFATFAMAALAGIGDCLPDTVTDRAITIRMRRRAPGEQVAQYRHRRDALPLHGAA